MAVCSWVVVHLDVSSYVGSLSRCPILYQVTQRACTCACRVNCCVCRLIIRQGCCHVSPHGGSLPHLMSGYQVSMCCLIIAWIFDKIIDLSFTSYLRLQLFTLGPTCHGKEILQCVTDIYMYMYLFDDNTVAAIKNWIHLCK